MEPAPAPAPDAVTVKKPPTRAISMKVLSSWISDHPRIETAMLPLGMILVQVFTMVTLLIGKIALNAGMRPFVFLFYRNLIAAAAIAPLAFIFEREMCKRVSLDIWGCASVNATFGIVLAMGLYYYGLRATSAAYSVNFLNLIAIVTFIIAILLRAEKLVLSEWTSKMKLLGTLMCVCGAMVVSLFKAWRLPISSTHLLRYPYAQAPATSATAIHHSMVNGTLFLCGSCLSYALWFILQARVAKVFPSKYLMTTLTCLLGSLLSLVVGIFLGHSRVEWKLSWDLQLLTIVYSGVFNTGITYVLISWAISRRGPIYPSMFSPVMMILTTVMDPLLLGTNIYVGSVLGTLLIIVGLYAFLWSKGEELELAAAAAAQKPADTEEVRDGDDMA